MISKIIAAASLVLIPGTCRDIIYSGMGFGTYYYDVKQVDACATSFEQQNMGNVECNFWTALSLNDINSNYLVAMNSTQLSLDPASYCGKRVIVFINGQPSDLPLFIGDGCQRCSAGSASNNIWSPQAAPGLDFSFSALSYLSNGSACDSGHISISWEIADETLYAFDTNTPGQIRRSATPNSDWIDG